MGQTQLFGLVLSSSLFLGGAGPALAERQASLQFSIGQMTDNEWGDLFTDWGSVRFRDATSFGFGGQLEWPVWRIGYIGIEGQALLWVGEQNHVEFTLPVFIRTPRPEQVWLPALSYGLGLSYATEPSESEIARTGSSTELIAHWFVELEFGNAETRFRPYLRLHHRSDAGGFFDADTGSNVLMVGLRRPF
ncbi:MAG: acyloxyacyl hydrolase [Rhodobacteraceae bacterium]|nr:acyloxyacyl hydrolase [Paracoccaceae bacterium]